MVTSGIDNLKEQMLLSFQVWLIVCPYKLSLTWVCVTASIILGPPAVLGSIVVLYYHGNTWNLHTYMWYGIHYLTFNNEYYVVCITEDMYVSISGLLLNFLTLLFNQSNYWKMQQKMLTCIHILYTFDTKHMQHTINFFPQSPGNTIKCKYISGHSLLSITATNTTALTDLLDVYACLYFHFFSKPFFEDFENDLLLFFTLSN